MALSWSPKTPWHWVALALVLAAVAIILLTGTKDRWRAIARARWARTTALALSLLAGACLVLALWNPSISQPPEPSRRNVVLVLDVSDSVLRIEGGWDKVRERAGKAVGNLIGGLTDEEKSRGTASIVTLKSSSNAPRQGMKLSELENALRSLEERDFATGSGTNLGNGLERARQMVTRAGGGTVMLVSDGHETEGNALAAAEVLANDGIPIYVLPIESRGPEVAIMSADLPRHVNSEAATFLRMVLHNSRQGPVEASITVRQYVGSGEDGTQGKETPVSLEGGTFLSPRQPLVFRGLGIQAADLTLRTADGKSEHRRRFYTHVSSPPRLLAVGGDNRWIGLLPAGSFVVDSIQPSEWPAPARLSTYDAVVISGVTADQFPSGALETLAKTVRSDGQGLMVINGAHPGPPDSPTTLMSYNQTPIESLLPVASGKRPEMKDAPARDVVIMIDSSGSMSGWQIEKSKELAIYVVKELLRRQDRLYLLAFTDKVLQLANGEEMTDKVRNNAIDDISRIQAYGLTDPTEALRIIAGRKLRNCGLIFISDAGFNTVNLRPECRATAFEIGKSVVPQDSPLRVFSDPFPVDQSFNPASIQIPYFDPEERSRYFEPGRFRPAATDALSTRAGRLPVPNMALDGAAVTFDKGEAEIVAVRPRLTDPVLAYGAAGRGYVGVFTGELPAEPQGLEEMGQALEAWLKALVSYMARDRYYFEVHDEGANLAVTVALAAKEGHIPDVTSISASLEGEGIAANPVDFEPDSLAPATFHGELSVQRTAQPQRAFLVLEEKSGAESLSRPQRIPIVIPPTLEQETKITSEAYSYGLNETLLRKLAEVTGGEYDAEGRFRLPAGKVPEAQKTQLWPWLLVLASASWLAAVIIQRLDL